ncbi:IclR family transcriptional regulator [Pseudarthrobacter sp. So.54]
MVGGSREPGRTVTSKVLSILEAFEESRGALSLTDIAETSGLPLSTTHRLVAELTDWGLLSREPNGRYQLGIRLWELAQNTGRQLRDAARPYVQDLFSLTGETAHLAVRAGHEVLYIDRVYGSKRVPRASRVGGLSCPCTRPPSARSSWPTRRTGCGTRT